MNIKHIWILGFSLLTTSCGVTEKMTSAAADVDVQVSTFPTIADLQILPERVSKTIEWDWNPFNTTSIEIRRDNVRVELLHEVGADVLVEPEYVENTTKLGGSITVSGYPAMLYNFRKATTADIDALKAVSMANGDNRYIVLDQNGEKGIIIGKTDSSIMELNAENQSNSIILNTNTDGDALIIPTENQTNSIATFTGSPVANDTKIDPVDAALANINKLTRGEPSARNAGRGSKNETTPVISKTNSSIHTNSDTQPNRGIQTYNQIIKSDDYQKYVGKSTKIPVVDPNAIPISYDRIGKDRFLITMAREYYGNPYFWPYIYEENRVKFADPDRITPGSGVVIPNLSKYGVDPNNPADVQKAKELGKEIYARFGKNYY